MWLGKARKHHEEANRHVEECGHAFPEPAPWQAATHALLALVAVTFAGVIELRRIREVLEHHQHPNNGETARLNLSGVLVSKEGTDPMPDAGVFKPSDTQDVLFKIDPKNAAGEPTADDFTWSLSDGAAGSLVVADDKKSARCVTNPGGIDAIVVVSAPRTGVNDTARITREAVPPPDNNTTTMGLTGEVVDK